MSLPSSLNHYEAEFETLDRCLSATRGIRVLMADHTTAMYFRQRLHQARALQRKKNSEVHAKGEPLHNASIYDSIIIKIKDDVEDNWWVYLEKNLIIPGVVEDLDEVGA